MKLALLVLLCGKSRRRSGVDEGDSGYMGANAWRSWVWWTVWDFQFPCKTRVNAVDMGDVQGISTCLWNVRARWVGSWRITFDGASHAKDLTDVLVSGVFVTWFPDPAVALQFEVCKEETNILAGLPLSCSPLPLELCHWSLQSALLRFPVIARKRGMIGLEKNV